jgi:hypothetical protein
MAGSAMATTVTSRISMSWATPRKPRMRQRSGWGVGSMGAVALGCSVVMVPPD